MNDVKFEKDDVVRYKSHVATIEYIDADYEFADIWYYNNIGYETHDTVLIRELEKL